MDDTQKKSYEIFYPYYLKKAEEVRSKNLKFVQYTSAEAAAGIIKNSKVWLRNCLCMNDYLEIEHGFQCLVKAYNGDSGKKLKTILKEIHPKLIDKFEPTFNQWIPEFRSSTYIACVSEHLDDENEIGRLSMWRAYGGESPVALVLNNGPFLTETDAFNAYTNPVEYLDDIQYKKEFDDLVDRVDADKNFLKDSSEENVYKYLFNFCKISMLCIKHPGFKEEKEWRVVYIPRLASSEYVDSSIEVINSVPQQVYKIPLKDIPEKSFYGASIPCFVDRIIIGPTNHQGVLYQTFVKLLENAGCTDAHEKVKISGIPLRR